VDIQELFSSRIDKDRVYNILKSLKFKNIDIIDRGLDRLISILGKDLSFLKPLLLRMFKIIKNLPDPDRGFLNLLKFLENTASPFIHFNFINQDYKILKTVLKIFSNSQFLADILITKPNYLEYFLFESIDKRVDSFNDLLKSGLDFINNFSSKELKLNAVRRFQKRELLRIGGNDILGFYSVEETTYQLSILADVILELIYRIENYNNSKVAIISLGKLGSLELNYSSDIDLIFVSESLDNNVISLAQRIIKDISDFSQEGFLYRVDTRLRPEGSKGSLVNDLDFYRFYFDNRARIWERQAYLKARFSAGDRDLGDEFIDIVKKFVYKKYMSYDEIQSIKLLKKSIEDRTISNNEWNREVKTGFGGIRDIEFFVQFIQLIFGGLNDRLRESNTFKALYKLYENSFIDYNEYKTLYKAYSFLRKLENFLQIAEYRQIHLLPENEQEREIIAKRLDFKSLKEFDSYYKDITLKVRSIFDKYFKEAFNYSPLIDIYFFDEDKPSQKFIETLNQYGITDVNSFYVIKELVNSLKDKYLFINAINLILGAIKDYAFDNNKAIRNIVRVINSYKGVDAFFNLIKNNPNFTKNIIKLVSFSDFIVEIIEKQPAVLDLLTEDNVLKNPTTDEQFDSIISNLAENIEYRSAIKMLYEMEIFKISSMDIIMDSNITEVCGMLSLAAEKILLYCINYLGLNTDDLAFIFLGKLAGKELSYRSDLDIIVICEDENVHKNINKIYKLIDFMKDSFNIDLRLRPDGKNSPIVTSISYFEKYMSTKIEDWERLFYSRSRVFSYSEGLRYRVEKIISNFVYKTDYNRLKSSIIDMRNKIATSFDKNDFKKGYGGLIDIEFVVCYYIIKDGIKYNGLLNTLKYLTERYQFFDNKIIESYLFLRSIENNVRLITNTSVSIIDDSLVPVISKRINLSENEFFQEYKDTRDYIKDFWEKFKENK